MKMHRFLSLTFCLLALTGEFRAQTWPGKPLHVIVPFAAGTFTDIVPRIVLEQVSAQIGQSIVVENRPGAGGSIGAGVVAKASRCGMANISKPTINLRTVADRSKGG